MIEMIDINYDEQEIVSALNGIVSEDLAKQIASLLFQGVEARKKYAALYNQIEDLLRDNGLSIDLLTEEYESGDGHDYPEKNTLLLNGVELMVQTL